MSTGISSVDLARFSDESVPDRLMSGNIPSTSIKSGARRRSAPRSRQSSALEVVARAAQNEGDMSANRFSSSTLRMRLAVR